MFDRETRGLKKEDWFERENNIKKTQGKRKGVGKRKQRPKKN